MTKHARPADAGLRSATLILCPLAPPSGQHLRAQAVVLALPLAAALPFVVLVVCVVPRVRSTRLDCCWLRDLERAAFHPQSPQKHSLGLPEDSVRRAFIESNSAPRPAFEDPPLLRALAHYHVISYDIMQWLYLNLMPCRSIAYHVMP